MNLPEYRAQIDQLDDQIIGLLGKRFAIARQVGALKSRTAQPVRQPARIQEVLARCAAAGVKEKLDPVFVRNLYQLIIEEMCRVESEFVPEPDASELTPQP
jgi:chorismate mutase